MARIGPSGPPTKEYTNVSQDRQTMLFGNQVVGYGESIYLTALDEKTDVGKSFFAHGRLAIPSEKRAQEAREKVGFDKVKVGTGVNTISGLSTKINKLEIIDFVVHEGHQYELCKIGHKFHYMPSKEWHSRYRPVPPNAVFHKNMDLNNKYHLAITHMPRDIDTVAKLSMPKIWIAHYDPASESFRQDMIKRLDGYYCIFNSFESQEKWNLPNKQKVIWAGIDPEEWYINEAKINMVLVVGNKIKERPQVSGYENLLILNDIPHRIVGENADMPSKPASSFEQMKQFYKTYTVLFSPTINSPMPRTRIEAMMSGMAVVSTDTHDASRFINNGENGFISNDKSQLKNYLKNLLHDTKLREDMGKKARETAIEYFSLNRFLMQWNEVLREVFNMSRVNQVNTQPTRINAKVNQNIGNGSIILTNKERSRGGGVDTINNIYNGFKNNGKNASLVSLSVKNMSNNLITILQNRKVESIFLHDLQAYSPGIFNYANNVYLVITASINYQTHYINSDGLLNLDARFKRIFCKDKHTYYYLHSLYGPKIAYFEGGFDGEGLRKKYGKAKWDNNAKLITAHRPHWNKNPISNAMAGRVLITRNRNYGYTITMLYADDKNNAYLRAFIKRSGFKTCRIMTETDYLGVSQDILFKEFVGSQLGIELVFSDACPRVPMQMMCLGLPCIVSPTVHWFKNHTMLKDNLMVDDPNDIEQTVRKAERLLKTQRLWESISKTCIEFTKKYTIDYEYQQIMKQM